MAFYLPAVWKPIGTKTTNAPLITPTAVVDHSDAGYVRSLQGWWLNYAPQPSGSGPYSCHFHVAWDGYVEQYVDTTRKAVANVAANYYGISIECSNSPDYRGSADFANDPYSPAQISALIKLHNWLADTHPTIPRKLCTDSVHGFGWHEQFASWTTRGHRCPGTRRIQQLQDIVYPATFNRTKPPAKDLDMTPAQAKQLTTISRDATKAVIYASIAARRGEIALSWAAVGGVQNGITQIYTEVLGRTPDTRGMTSWSNASRSATYTEVRDRVAASREANARR